MTVYIEDHICIGKYLERSYRYYAEQNYFVYSFSLLKNSNFKADFSLVMIVK